MRWAAMALPTFHSMGILTQLMAPLISAEPVGVYGPRAPAPPVVPNPQNLLDAIRLCGCNGVMIVPSFVEVCHATHRTQPSLKYLALQIWAESDENVKFLTTLNMIVSVSLRLSQK